MISWVKTIVSLTLLAALLGFLWSPQADGTYIKDRITTLSGVYTENRISVQLVSGAVFSPTILATRTPVFNYWQTNLRMGYMLNTPPPSKSLFRGNFEFLAEITYSDIFNGFGHYMAGITGLVRYNFVQPDSKLIPYFQIGAGIVYTDAHKDKSQTGIGQAAEFTPQGSFGLHYLIKKPWSLDAEATFEHISNAGIADRNRGINGFGGFVGITYFTHWLWK